MLKKLVVEDHLATHELGDLHELVRFDDPLSYLRTH